MPVKATVVPETVMGKSLDVTKQYASTNMRALSFRQGHHAKTGWTRYTLTRPNYLTGFFIVPKENEGIKIGACVRGECRERHQSDRQSS